MELQTTDPLPLLYLPGVSTEDGHRVECLIWLPPPHPWAPTGLALAEHPPPPSDEPLLCVWTTFEQTCSGQLLQRQEANLFSHF